MKAGNELMIYKINFFFEIKNNNLLFQIVQNEFEFTLLIDFVLHIAIQLRI